MLQTILKILGIGGGGSLINDVAGAANHLIALPVIGFLVTHADQKVDFSATLGFLALIVGFAYLIIEIVRRSPSGG